MRLIDADALIVYIKKRLRNEMVIAWLCRIIGEVPTIEAEPVKHGRWVDNGIPESMLSKCSVCDYSCGAYSFNYCPNCGAKMDLEE